MADITADGSVAYLNKNKYVWNPVTEADAPQAVNVSGGRYSCNIEGAFGGGTIEFQFSVNGSAFHSLDATALTFSADGTVNIEVPRGQIKPVVSGGSSMSVIISLIPIPTSEA